MFTVMFTVGLKRHGWLVRDKTRPADPIVPLGADWPVGFTVAERLLQGFDGAGRPRSQDERSLRFGLAYCQVRQLQHCLCHVMQK